MKEHDNSDEHRSALATLIARKNDGGRVDKSLVLQTEEEIKYWDKVFETHCGCCELTFCL